MRRHFSLAVVKSALAPVLAEALAAVLSGVWSPPARAQACTADYQCSPSASGFNVCLGDTLIMRRRLCISGQCVEQELGRIDCGGGGGIGGVCQGNAFIRSGNRCDAAAGRCAQGSSIAIACVKSCTCTGRTLTISTGLCTPGVGCGRAVMRCKVGCTCAPEPRCTDDPPAKRGEAPVEADNAEAMRALEAARAANELPPRWAEPFEADPPPGATPARPGNRVKPRQRKSRRT